LSFTTSTEEKLAESSAANAALSSQLENIAPQLASLEKSLSDTKHKLEIEQQLRRQAELAQDEAEARAREAEAALTGLREECDQAHEQLAFCESELEETKLELEVERERHKVELEELQQDVAVMASRSASGAMNGQVKDKEVAAFSDKDFLPNKEEKEATFVDEDGFPAMTTPPKASAAAEEDDYVKRLEDELELVTEQLIDTEQRLTETEELLAEEQRKVKELAAEPSVASSHGETEEALLKLKEEHHSLTEQVQQLKEELELMQEELSLTQEELKASEADVANLEDKLEQVRLEHRDELSELRAEADTARTEHRTAAAELTAVEETLQKTTAEAVRLKEEVKNLEKVLENARKDYAALEQELEEVNSRFDDVRTEAEKAGREAATEDVQSAMQVIHGKELDELRGKIRSLEEANGALQNSLDTAEMELATARDSVAEEKKMIDSAQSETVKTLQEQLMRTKDELTRREGVVEELKQALDTRVCQAEAQVTKLEKELSATKGKLAEAEAHLIVWKQKEKSATVAKAMPSKKKKEARDQSPLRETDIDMDDTLTDGGGEEEAGSRRSLRYTSPPRRTRSASPDTSAQHQMYDEEEKKKLETLRKEYDDLKEQHRMGEARIKHLESDLKTLQKQLFSGGTPVVTQMSRLSATSIGAGVDNSLKDTGSSNVEEVLATGDLDKIADEFRALAKKSAMQREHNSQLLAKILSLQGNIQVCCRVRPISLKEMQQGNKVAVEALSETEVGCHDFRTNKWKSFAFDRVWGPDQGQHSIFQDVEPLALSVVDGFNACIFAYGQT
jgi:kinesin family protein C2/C3